MRGCDTVCLSDQIHLLRAAGWLVWLLQSLPSRVCKINLDLSHSGKPPHSVFITWCEFSIACSQGAWGGAGGGSSSTEAAPHIQTGSVACSVPAFLWRYGSQVGGWLRARHGGSMLLFLLSEPCSQMPPASTKSIPAGCGSSAASQAVSVRSGIHRKFRMVSCEADLQFHARIICDHLRLYLSFMTFFYFLVNVLV